MRAGRVATCPVDGCGAEVPIPIPAGCGENRWICPACGEALEFSVSTGKLYPIRRPAAPPRVGYWHERFAP